MTIRAAILISILVHSLAIAPFSFNILARHDERRSDEIIVDYVVAKAAEEKRQTVLETKMRDEPRLDINKRIDVRPALPINVTRPAQRKSAKDRSDETARIETHIKSTKDYINYYSLIREKIRACLRDDYKSYHGEGEVTLTFVLNSAGAVESIAIDPMNSTNNKSLQNISLSSIKEASPYPSFPKALTLPKMSFSLQISFKKQ